MKITISRLIYPTIIFLVYFLVIITVFSAFGARIDGDSDSYSYLLHEPFMIDYQRPIVYPLVLRLISYIVPFHTNEYGVVLFVIQTLLLSLSGVLMFVSLNVIIHNKPISFIVTLLCLFYYPLIRLVNFMNPEVLLTFFIMLLTYFSLNSKLFVSRKRICAFFVVGTLATFTKPIMIYFLAVEIFFFLAALFIKRITFHNFIFSIVIAVVTGVMPIIFWSNGTLQEYSTFSFSVIKNINLLGKLIAYDLIDRGPDYVNNIPIRKMLSRSHSQNIWNRLRLLESESDTLSITKKQFNEALFIYGDLVFRQNIVTYMMDSLYALPKIFNTEYEFKVAYCAKILNDLAPSIDDASICRNDISKTFLVVYYQLYIVIAGWLMLPCLVITAIVFIVKSMTLILRGAIDGEWSLCVYCLFFYFGACNCFGAYEQYGRLMAPIQMVVIIVFCASIYSLIQFVRSAMRS